jgi:Pyridoxal phosphate biosynthesis protein PdxJ
MQATGHGLTCTPNIYGRQAFTGHEFSLTASCPVLNNRHAPRREAWAASQLQTARFESTSRLPETAANIERPLERERISTFFGSALAGRQIASLFSRAGTPAVEIHTGHYADADNPRRADEEVERVRWVDEAGIQVNAGHGPNYHNVESIAATPGVSELSIGHVIVARTLYTGLQEPVREMKRLMIEAHR